MVVVVCSIVARSGGKILMVREKKKEASGKYGLPGGQLEQGEELIECARREFFEETGYVARNTKLVAITHKPSTRFGNSVVRFVYDAEVSAAPSGTSELETVWLSKSEIITLFEQGNVRGADVLDLLDAGRGGLTISTY